MVNFETDFHHNSDFLMKDMIQKTITFLKYRVKSNLELINQNQLRIKQILRQPTSEKRNEDFEKHYELNKSLLAENNDFINIQFTLINFLEKYKSSAILNGKEEKTNVKAVKNEKELFDLTINGEIDYDVDHPLFNDDSFFKKLLDYYKSTEEYEKCQELINLKSSDN
jgi:hypothetical protein